MKSYLLIAVRIRRKWGIRIIPSESQRKKMSNKKGWLTARTKEGNLISLCSREEMDVIKFLTEVKEECAPDEKQFVSRVLRKFVNAGWIEYDVNPAIRYLIEEDCNMIDEDCVKQIGLEEVNRIIKIADETYPSELKLRLEKIVIWVLSVILYLAMCAVVLVLFIFIMWALT